MHGCMTEYVFCNHPRADGRIAVVVPVLHPIAVKAEVWHQVGIDIVGPLTLTKRGLNGI